MKSKLLRVTSMFTTMATKQISRALLSSAFLLAFAAPAQAILIGAPATGGNCFPFGCGDNTNTRYQQVYSSSEFSDPLSIGEIRFFPNFFFDGDLNSGTYTFSLSTTLVAVDSLNTTDFDANLGTDNSLFTVAVLTGGPVPATLSFLGNVFNYVPTTGNLLLDIQITDLIGGFASFDARNGDAGGIFSRAHNFGSGFEGYGLVTEFLPAQAQVPEPATLALLGLGLAGLGFMRRRRT